MSLPRAPATAQTDQPPKRPSVVSRHSSGSKEQLSTSHQKPKVGHHVVGKRNKSSSHLVKLNKSHSAKNLASKNLKPITGTRVKRSSSHIKFKVSQDEGEPEEPIWDGPELKRVGNTGKGKGKAGSDADSEDEASLEGETESSREPSSSRGAPVKRHSILKSSPLVQAATNEPAIQDDMQLPGPAQEDTSTRVRAHRMVSFAAEPQISQISNITSHDSTSTAPEEQGEQSEQSEQSGSVEDVVDARRQGSRVADVPAGQQTDSQSMEKDRETFHHQPHAKRSDLAARPTSDQEGSAEESPKIQAHQMEITRPRQDPRQTTFQLGKRQQPEHRTQRAQAGSSQQELQHSQEATSEQLVQHAQEESHSSQTQQTDTTRHQPIQTTFQLEQNRQPEQRFQEAPEAQPQPEMQHIQEAQPQQKVQQAQNAKPQAKVQHAQPAPQMPRATHQLSTNTTRSNSNTQTPSRHPTPDHEHNDHPALPLPINNLASETPLTRPSTPTSPLPEPSSSTNPTQPKSLTRTQYKLAMERQHVLNFRPPRQRPTNAPLPSNLTGQTDSRIDPTTGRVLTRNVCVEAKKDLAALRVITRRDPICEAIDGLRLWTEWEDREGAWTSTGRVGAGETVKSARGIWGGRKGGKVVYPAQTLSEEEVARKKKFVAFMADGGLHRKLREMWEAPVE